jgi:hypothetical protein
MKFTILNSITQKLPFQQLEHTAYFCGKTMIGITIRRDTFSCMIIIQTIDIQ